MAIRSGFRSTSIAVVAFALAMAYVESAVVVYLDAALSVRPEAIFPLRDPASAGNLAVIEVGRELATLVMLGTLGWLVGRSGIERLAWASVAFGVWDIAYYGWLFVFAGWPPTLTTWDLLFLVPVPWVGPVWAPVTVSLALVAFGLAAARRCRVRRPPSVGRRQVAAGLAGGLIVIVSFTLDAGSILAGGVPVAYPWPVFAAGMLIAAASAASSFRTDRHVAAQPSVADAGAAGGLAS